MLLPGCVDEQVDPLTGAQLYLRHCASCHGVQGKGDGPLAITLRGKPSDLTQLARNAGGRFDETAVMMTIDGRRAVAAHGPREMPVWGVIFQEQHVGEPFAVYRVAVEGQALADHLRSIQAE